MALLVLSTVSFVISLVSAGDAYTVAPSIEVQAVVNKTLGSLIYPFACYSYPTLATTPLKYFSGASNKTFSLNCWTRSIPSWKAPAGAAWQLSQYDSEIFWFHSEPEDCWFPDYLVQKNAVYAAGVLPWNLDLPGPGQGPPGASPSMPGKTWVPIPPSAPASSPTTLPAATPSSVRLIVPIIMAHGSTKKARPPPEKGPAGAPPEPSKDSPASNTSTPANPWGSKGGAKGTSARGKGGPMSGPWARPKGAGIEAAMSDIWKLANSGPKPSDDLKLQIRYCPQPSFQAGTFREQYNGQSYCYSEPRLDSENKRLNLSPVKTVELSCWKMGTSVEEDPTWWQLTSEACYVPNQVFDPLTFRGNAGPCR